ncbi:CHAP domain-containing protein [Sphingobium sp. H39-3-25]|nr:CHAP domain-containing protein [Sphingobium arseniciresistens]
MVAASLFATSPAKASDPLQCVPYARTVSGIDIRGDAWTWWGQAEGRFERGHVPRKGAVIAFESFGPMRLGHVAVVSRIISDREILIRHANWSSPGAIETDVPVIDVSANGDWSQVRVWHSPTGQMGARTNPVHGFIYGSSQRLNPFVPGLDPERDDDDLLPQRRYLASIDVKALQRQGRMEQLNAAPRLKLNMAVLAMEDVGARGRQRFAMADAGTRRTLAEIFVDIKRDARGR